MNLDKESIKLHKKLGGKLEIRPKLKIKNKYDLSLVYTPGVAAVCKEIAKSGKKANELTFKKNSVAIVSDGSAVLGLGNIGAKSALPVMEGKAMLFKQFANIDAVPLCLDTQNVDEIVNVVKNISPNFAGINLEDISAPRCFEIEEKLLDLGIPVFHDDQHGTAIVILAALINALKLRMTKFSDAKVVINGAGAAGIATTKLLLYFGRKYHKKEKDIIVCDHKGIISKNRTGLNKYKKEIAKKTNRNNLKGKLADALKDADVFIGVSKGGLLSKEMVKTMNKPIIFAMANPIPEIMPNDAKKSGAFLVGTGRSDFPNQINNLLAFPGIFRGAIDSKAKKITYDMKIKAAFAIAKSIKATRNRVLPSALDSKVVRNVSRAVGNAK